jgi:hypothetical protein
VEERWPNATSEDRRQAHRFADRIRWAVSYGGDKIALLDRRFHWLSKDEQAAVNEFAV